MHRYWFEFKFESIMDVPPGIAIGCGVTAYDIEDAMFFLKSTVFNNGGIPELLKVIEDVDIDKLDHNHVLPNMSPPNYRGIWFPIGYHI